MPLTKNGIFVTHVNDLNNTVTILAVFMSTFVSGYVTITLFVVLNALIDL